MQVALLLTVSCSALFVAQVPALLIASKPALLLGFSLVVNARENSLQLPNPETRNPPSNPELKGPLVQIGGGTFVTHPTFWTSAFLSHVSPPPIAPFSPFEIPGRHNLSTPAMKPHHPPSATSPLPSQSLFPDDVVHRNNSTFLIHLPG